MEEKKNASFFEVNISKHDFEEAKVQLKKFSEQDKEKLAFSKVRTHEVILGLELTEHGVTGKEFNNLTEQIQSYISKFYDRQHDLIKEFGQVYKALEALDKDYIQAILSTVKAIEKTNQNILSEQKRIDETIVRQEATLHILKKFKEDIANRPLLDNQESYHDIVSQLENRIRGVENNFVSINNQEIVNHNLVFQLQQELEYTKNQIQSASNKFIFLFIAFGITVAILLFVLLFVLLR